MHHFHIYIYIYNLNLRIADFHEVWYEGGFGGDKSSHKKYRTMLGHPGTTHLSKENNGVSK